MLTIGRYTLQHQPKFTWTKSKKSLTTIEAILEKWVPYSQRYLFNAIPDTNHNANPNPTNPTNPTNHNTRYRCEYCTHFSRIAYD